MVGELKQEDAETCVAWSGEDEAQRDEIVAFSWVIMEKRESGSLQRCMWKDWGQWTEAATGGIPVREE